MPALLSFVELVKLRNRDLVMEFRGELPGGKGFFAYILCNEAQVKLMHADVASGIKRGLMQYGDVLYHDFISGPDDNAREFLQNWCTENNGGLL